MKRASVAAGIFLAAFFPALIVAAVLRGNGSRAAMAASPAAPPAMGSSSPSSYVVQKGDTLWGIAARSGVALDALQNANPDVGRFLQIGEKLNIPARGATTASAAKPSPIAAVPFFSQLKDISSPQWQQVGCGITSLAMVIDYYKPNAVSVNALLKQGIAAGAYDANAGWIFAGLIRLSRKYGLTGESYDLSGLGKNAAVAKLQDLLEIGPLIVSVHNRFDPNEALPHLVVADGMKSGTIYYNDPAARAGNKKISVDNFLDGWMKDVIVLRPANGGSAAQLGLNM